ncbi:hypothetical protein Cni_G17076 [Canna indica]|uniref:WRKY domain-containing protein n=1 Tax=Canna indica TaxID=4628 RepID=A0AAQ3QGF2_9LILI|nr:hypothetical protein Cni_G17076 [Canna indica]
MANDDWDLGAVVRSCRLSSCSAPAARRSSFASFPLPVASLEVAEEAEGGKGFSFLGFPDLFRGRNNGQELEELYKPFFPKVPQQSLRAGASTVSPASAAPLPAPVAGPVHQPPSSRIPHRPLSQIPRSKRRKNQQKKVVCHVPATGLSSDVWAWRKYGQKPIKGSPYPRGYYRCSSSKSCLARKQVERSRADPGMFIITYTAEHNHAVPTHRNSLAGSTRHKLPSSAPAAAPGGDSLPPAENSSTSPPSSSTAAELSPTTPLTSSMEDEVLHPRQQEGDEGDEGEEDLDEDEGMLLVEDLEMIGEDDLLFMGFEEEASVPAAGGAASAAVAFLGDDGGLGDHFLTPPWLSSSKNAAAAAGGR